MSKPSKDRPTPSGSSPVDVPGVSAGDHIDESSTAENSAESTDAATSSHNAKNPSAAGASKSAASKPATKPAKAATKTAAKTPPKKAAKSTSRSDAAEELARRTTAQKVRVTGGDNPVWWVPVMVGLMVFGLIWLVVTYLAQGDYPAPSVGVVWNLGIGFGLVMLGFLMTTRWK